MNSVRDYSPYFDYARFLNKTIMKIESPDMVTNYNGGFPEITSNVKPQLIQFGPILAIEGRGVEVLEGSAFIKAHPGVEYIVNVYEDIDSVKARFKAMYGYNITEYDWYTKEHEVSEELQKDSKSPTGRLIAGSDDILSEAIVRKVSDVAIQIEKDILAYSPRNNKCLMLVGHCLSGDTKLRLLDGTSKTIRELSSVYEPDQEFWVYSCKEDGEVVPAPAMFSRVTKTVDKMAHVTLDNGEVIKCTVDHPFMMRDGSYVPADRLVSGDSLMPLYYRKTGEESSYLQAYPRIIDNKSGDEVLVHRLVVSSVLGGYKNPLTICHHKDFNQSNNDPSNLILMTKEDHDNLHKSGWREVRSQNGKDTSYRIHHSEEFKSTRKLLSELASIHISEFNKTSWKNPEYRQKISSQTSQLHKDGLLVLSKESLSLRNSRRNKTLWGNPEYRQKMSDMLASRSYNWIKPQTELSIISTRRNKVLKIVKSMLDSGTKLSESVYESLRPKCGTLSYSKAINYFGSEQELLRQASVFNHKVVSVVIVDSLNTPVYDITVPDYHNFALASGVFVHNSGIAKSAIIKSVVDKLDNAAKKPTAGALAGKEIDIKTDEVINDHPRWGYRIIDIRSAFLDKADFLGYVHLEELDGKQVWTDSPKSELLAASTAFVKETRKFIMGTPRTALNGPTLDRLYELAKTPVIFFDEINRAPISIMSQIMVIINQHRLNDYNVDIAVKIAAINSLSTPRGGPNDKQAAIVYHTTDVFDKAIRDRFIAIEMSASDQSIIDGTYNWLKDTFKASYLATSILNTAYSKKMLYKIEMVDDNGKFPTFRGWEHICQYAVWCEKQKIKPMQMIIDSLVGKDAGKQLGLKDVDYSAATEQFIEHTTAAGVPMLLLGKMGIGKTAKMNAVASKTNIEMIRVDLSAQDRTTVSGYPKVEGLCDYMVDKGLQDESFKAWSAALLKNPKVPIQTTAFIPNKQLAEKISICRRMGKKLVIMFDEVNRPFTLDTKVKLMDGTILTMQEIIDKYGTNEYFWIYSSDADGNIHPAKARSLGITRKQDKVVKVSLDNGSNEKCSLDHPWMLRNGTYVEAQYLKPGDSLMPLYYQFDEAGYEMVKNNYTGVWEYTHRLSDEYNILTGLYPRVGTVRHHKNFNKKNNSPDNIQRMTWSQHRSIHHAHLETTLGKHHSRMQKDPAYLADLLSKTLQNPDYMQKAHVNSAKTRSSSQQYKEKKSIHMLSQHKNGVFSHDLSKASKKTVLNRTISIVKKLIEQGITLTEENYTEYKNKYRGTSGRGGNVALSLSKIKEQFGSFNDFIHLATCNHKVVSVEVLDKLEDVSCLTVEGYNNFALASGVIVHNCTPVVQSAVFEAISDHRLFGNDLTGIEYSVVAAGNKGEGYQVAEMDTATLHRFATLTINTLTAEDLNEWKNYLAKTNQTFTLGVLKELGDKNVIEMLNKEYDKSDVSLADPDLSMRSFQALENTFYKHVYKVVTTEATPMEAAEIMKEPDYILRQVDPETTTKADDKSLQVLYGYTELSSEDFIARSLELLADIQKGVNPVGTEITWDATAKQQVSTVKTPYSTAEDAKNAIMTYIQMVDDDRYNIIRKEVKAIVPQAVQGQFDTIMRRRFHARSVGGSVKGGDLSGSDAAIDMAIKQLFDDPSQVEDKVASAIVTMVEKAQKPIPSSQITKIRDRYKSITGYPLNMDKLGDLSFFDHKITVDKPIKVQINLIDFINSVKGKIRLDQYNVENEMSKRHNITDDTEVVLYRLIEGIDAVVSRVESSGQQQMMFKPRYVSTGPGMSVVDYYSIISYYGPSLTFDAATWKLTSIQKDPASSLDYIWTWEAKYMFYTFQVSCSIVTPKEFTDIKKVIHQNISQYDSVINTLSIYDGKKENMPTDILDVKKIEASAIVFEIKDAQGQVVTRTTPDTVLVNTLAKIWRPVERVFLNTK